MSNYELTVESRRSWPLPKKLTYTVLIVTLIAGLLTSFLKIPNQIIYLNDALVIILSFYVIPKIIFDSRVNKLITTTFFLMLFFFYFSALINLVPLRLVIWGSRNLIRFYIIYYAVIFYFSPKDIKIIFDAFLVFQVVNLVVGLYQYFFLHFYGDAVGGLFSMQLGKGNGGGLDPFCLLLITYYLNVYIAKKESLKKLLFCIASSIILAIIAGEKFILIGLVIVFAASILLNHFSLRNFAITFLLIVVTIVGAFALKKVDPNTFDILSSFNNMLSYSELSYNVGYRIPRIGTFKVINNLFLYTIDQQLFGLGFGNCDTSSITLFQSDFYNIYGNYNYRWFVDQWTYLECGLVGFLCYLSFFIVNFIVLLKKLKIAYLYNRSIIVSSIVFTVISIATIWYNNSLKLDTAYLMYFGIAMGICVLKDTGQNQKIG